MPNTPKRPDVQGIRERAIALKGTLRDDPKMELRVDQLLFYNIPALIAYIKALEVRMEKLKMFARMARERGQLENAIAYLDGNDKAFAEFDGGGDG